MNTAIAILFMIINNSLTYTVSTHRRTVVARLGSNTVHTFATPMYLTRNDHVEAQVAQRDDAPLTSEEVKRRWGKVVEALGKELRAWVKVNGKRRSGARNIVDARWIDTDK